MTDNYTPLDEDVVTKAVASLPDSLRTALRKNPLFHRTVFIAGGFMACIAGDGFLNSSCTDIDCWTTNDRVSDDLSLELVKIHGDPVVVTDNAATFSLSEYSGHVDAIQVITKNHFDSPQIVMDNFDFSICSAAIWRDGEVWRGLAHKDWLSDVMNKRLRYTQTRHDFGDMAHSSLIRSYKWTARGFEIDAFSLATILTMLPQYGSLMDAMDHFDPTGNGGPIAKLNTGKS
jgi:hypothetical protein